MNFSDQISLLNIFSIIQLCFDSILQSLYIVQHWKFKKWFSKTKNVRMKMLNYNLKKLRIRIFCLLNWDAWPQKFFHEGRLYIFNLWNVETIKFTIIEQMSIFRSLRDWNNHNLNIHYWEPCFMLSYFREK